MGQHHYIDCETQDYQAVERGDKKFLVTLITSGLKTYDFIHFQEVVHGVPTKRTIGPLEVNFIEGSEHPGIVTGFCVLNWR